MSATHHVITNFLGSGDYVVVYETCAGEVVFEGNSISPRELFNILDSTIGCYEDVKYHQLTDSQMENWIKHIYR